MERAACAGFAVMLHSGLATNPYALTAIVCSATFVVAPVTLTVYRYAAFLTLITFHSLILCQYKCAPSLLRAQRGACAASPRLLHICHCQTLTACRLPALERCNNAAPSVWLHI